MADLTITLSGGVYSVSPDPCYVPVGGNLNVIVPQGPPVGCLICLDKDLESKKSHVLTANRTFPMNYPNLDKWTYTVWAPTATCPTASISATTPHTIQIGSQMGGK